jgi:hypothetical protein
MRNRRSLVVLGVCASGAGVAIATPASSLASTADAPHQRVTPPRPRDTPPSPLEVADAVAYKAGALARHRIIDRFACVTVASRTSRRPKVVLKVTSQSATKAAMGVLEDATRGVGVTPDLVVRRPRLAVVKVDQRFAQRTMTSIARRLRQESRRWVAAGSPTIPGVNSPIDCGPVTIVMEGVRTPDQLEWAQRQQQTYGADRIALALRTGNEPAPTPDR